MQEKLLLEKKRLGLKETISAYEIELLVNNVPLQKIIGFIDFNNLKISVKENVFIPRYETEEVVNLAIELINDNDKVLDLATGSGYIGLTIKQKTNAYVTLADISDDAIKQATINAIDNNLDVEIIKSDMFKNISGKFNMIISNPPYIPNLTHLPKSVIAYEPNLALFGGEDGNDFYKQIIHEGPKYLLNNGWIIFEISEANAKYLALQGFKIFNDINKKKRIAIKQF